MPVKVQIDDEIAVLRMEEPRGNALSYACMTALHAALDEAESGGARAVVVTGKGSVFSVGLDLVAAFDFDRAEMRRYTDAFEAMFLRLFTLPLPVVAAVNGHALAGGCVLALACDAQLMSKGAFAIGLNEVALGIPFPSVAFEASRYGVPPSSWNEVFLEGRRMTPEEAHAAGIVEALVPTSTDVVAAAVAKASTMARGGRAALAATKQDLKREHADRASERAESSRARFVDAWFAEDARARIGRLRDDLLAKR